MPEQVLRQPLEEDPRRMKLATIKDGSRDGRLVVVSRDLTQMTDAAFLARTLQAALDDWARVAPHLATLAQSLETGAVPAERFHEHDAASPLPRAYQWIEAATDAAGPDDGPALRQGASDAILGPREPILAADEAWGIDLAGGIAVITGDVPMGAAPAEAREAIRLVMLVNAVALRGSPDSPAGTDGRPGAASPAFSPVAVTPDELGDAWDGGRLSGTLCVDLNGKPLGRVDAGIGTRFDFPALIARAARTRRLAAGTIVGSGAIADRPEGGQGASIEAGGSGHSSLAGLRRAEAAGGGDPDTPFLGFGDTVRIEMLDERRHSIFGAIEQSVESA